MDRRRAVAIPVWVLLVAFGGWILWGRAAWGAHFDNTVSDLASFCIDCHTLNSDLADANTSFIQSASRTLPSMRSLNGGSAPATFGCTYCHNDALRTIQGKAMKDAFNPFLSKPSQHPFDRSYSKDGYFNVTLGSNTGTTLFMSNWDNTWGAMPTYQIGCIQCHDPGAAYPNHPIPGDALRVNNPFMLRGGDSSWNTTDNHASNAFCLQICHSGSAPGTAGYRMGHYGWGAYDNTTGGMPDNTLKEGNGTALKTSKCVDCHETHSANAKPNLMGEQRQSNLNIDSANCTNVCHGNTDFVSSGHGKTGINLTCANCHNASVSHRDQFNPKRFSGTEMGSSASLEQDYSTNGRDDNFDGVIDDAGEATLKYSMESICSATCHTDMHVHQGEIGGTSGSASCLHCHDMHGHGVDNNVMMVRRTVMGRTTNYWTSGTDLYRTDNASICDNPNCHAKPLGDTATPGTIMGDVQEHKDTNVGPGTNCTSCHNHSSTTGGASFAPVCNACHTYPGQSVLAGTHVLGGAHDRHVASDNVGGYSFSCSTCHNKYSHNQSGVNTASEWSTKFQAANVNIKFDGVWNPINGSGPLYAGVAADNTLADNVYAPGVGGTGTCAGLYCHGDSTTVASWPAGTDNTPEWNNNATGACGTCHRATAAVPPQTFAHAKHADNTSIGYAVSCRKCHYQTTSDGLTVTNRSAHLNRQSQISFDTTDALLSSGSYGGTTTVGDSGTTTGTCSNIYCHSPGSRTGPPFDNAALGPPDWKTAGPLACNACHGAPGQTGARVGMPDYPNGSPKVNSHARHLDDQFTCRVCHFGTTTTDNSIADRSIHVNGTYDAVNDNIARHAFGYSASNCSAAVCHGGWSSGPNMPAWGAGPYACDVCHMNSAGSPAAADADQFAYDNGMAKINADQWNGAINGSGHGRTSAYPSGNPGAGSRFASCTANCHTSTVGHDNSVNFFRLRTYSGIVDFSDTNQDPAAQQDDNRICLDCHSSTGANPVKASRLVDQNHYGTWVNNKHTASTMGGTFCVDCHDPHGDSNHYMVQDNVTKTSDGVYGIPTVQAPVARFTQQNLDGASGLDGVYDWGDYVKSSAPYTGICQTCHASSGGADYFNTGASGYTATHNKAGSPPSRCTACHLHSEDFSPSCTSCHGEPTAGNGSPPSAPFSGNRIWPASVDNTSNLAGMGNHRSRPASGIDNSGHDPFMTGTSGCTECHTGTPGSGSDHNVGTNTNATMTNIAAHNWYTGAAASWSAGPLDGGIAGGSVVDDSCSNINCHSPYYGAPANQYRSATPMPYTRYWLNQALWDCYTCHAYDGRTATSRPAGTDNTMATGMHTAHVGTAQLACSNCHDVTGYVTTSFTGNHKNGFINWDFSGAPNPFGTSPAYSVASGSRAPTDDNTAAGHPSWGGCSNLYCHSTVQASPPSGGTGVTYATPAWDNVLTGQCGTCHAGDGTSGNLTLMSTGTHGPHLASGYAMTCAACHTGAGTGSTVHADMAIQVPIGDSSWRSFTLTAATTIFDRATAPGVDNANAFPGTAYGRCSSIPCHSDGNGGAPRINPAIWGDTQAAATNCTYCHGGNASSGAAMSTGSHTKHVSSANLPCGKCHNATVSTAADNTITGYSVHVNGEKNVQFSAEVGGTYDNAAKTCSATYCHGVAPSPAWGSGPIAGCSICHQNQGVGAGSYSGSHHAHSNSSATADYRIACETCHAIRAGSHPNTTHAGGPDNATWAAKTAEVMFTDNGASQTYDNVAITFRSKDLWLNPFTNNPESPGYAGGGSSAGNDNVNPQFTWTQGTCSNVWCHSNANPIGWKGTAGTNALRSPTWTAQGDCSTCHGLGTFRNCDVCHAYSGTAATMTGPDKLSNAHITHAATDRYAFTCDECHAWTVVNDPPSTPDASTIIDGPGHDNHVNGIKTVRFGSTLRTTAIDQSGGAYDNGARTCSNLYCHSSGIDNVTFGVPLDNAISWNSATGGTCATCHGASATTLTSNAHSRHLSSGFTCNACHYDTAVDNATLRAGTGYTTHVNGVRNVVLDNTYDNTPADKTDDWASPTCSNVKCHGGVPVAWNAGSLSCDACHTKTNNVDVTADVDDFTYNSGTMSKIAPADFTARGHGAGVNLPWTGGTNPGGQVCLDCHSNASNALHDNAANPFRFRGTINAQTVAFDNVDTICYACHSSASVMEHGKSVTGGGSSAWEHTQKCVDCHDVHGESNIFMVHDNIVWQTNGGSTYATSDGYGVPFNPASRTQVIFSSNAAGSDYASTDNAAPYNGICEVCHTRTAQYQRDTSNGKAGVQSHLADKCTNCHKHDAGFKGSGCNGCHGSGVTGQYWPSSTPGTYPNRAGAHQNHVDTIGSWLYGETAATGLLADSAKGTTDAKQKALCTWCHPSPGSPRPGTGETVHSDYVAPADVHGDGRAGAAASYLQYYDGNLATPGSDNNTAAAYDNTTLSCSNTRCHNNVATPSGGNDWRTPPAWNTSGCDSAQCHATSAASGGHHTHYALDTANPPGMMYSCSQCHVVPSSLRHGNGQVNLSFSGLEATRGGGDGFYDKDNSGTQTAGDNNFKAFDNVYTRTCRNIYCHGADNAWGGSGTTPSWDNASAGDCGTCHGAYGSPYDSGGGPHNPVVTGNHPVHFRQYDAGGQEVTTRGPRLTPHSGDLSGGCVPCHNINGAGSNCTNACHRTGQGANWPTGTHADGNIDFRDNVFVNPPGFTDPYSPSTLAATPACNNCHSTATVVTAAHPNPGTTGVAEAKGNWGNAAYRLDCLTCHNGSAPANSNSGGTGLAAPNMYGDGSSFGAEARGHNRTTASGPYPVTGNPAANRACDACHDTAASHIDGTDNTTYAGNRLLSTVNGNATGSTVSGLCAACHTTSGSSPATKKSINTHGNAGYTGNLENQSGSTPPSPGAFQATCNQCHEPHGMVNVTAPPAGVNLWMINPTITVTTGVTQSPVRLFARTGANSFDNTGTSSDLCRTCHANTSNPGYPMTYNVAGQHAAPGYTGDERGKDCSGCHSHNQDDNTATVDGLMPLACNACHSYPGVAGGSYTKAMSAVHGKHVGTPTDTLNSRQYECTVCHFGYSHNGNGLSAGQAWPGTYYTFVNIDFDPSINPSNANGPKYNNVNTPTTGNGGTGACAGIYCHGNSASQSTWGGTTTTTPPQWDNTVTASCGSCHRADSTMPQGNHPTHLSAAYGPGSSAFTASGTCSEGTGCHTAYGFSPTTSHVNGQPSFRTTTADNTPVGLGATQICRNCHSTYASSAGVGDTLVRTTANWDNTSYKVPCITCHNAAAAASTPPNSQGRQNLDGSGDRAPDVEAVWASNGHGSASIDNASTTTDSGNVDQVPPVRCETCHDETGLHIGTAKDTTNPWRLDNTLTNYTQTGGLDRFCLTQCHSQTSLATRHAQIVNGTWGVLKDSALHTHPTALEVVPSTPIDKSRWQQVPSDPAMPLAEDLVSKTPPARGNGSLLACVTCHDPHGVAVALITTRTFSGANTMGAGAEKMLRYNPSGSQPTPLCSKCHK